MMDLGCRQGLTLGWYSNCGTDTPNSWLGTNALQVGRYPPLAPTGQTTARARVPCPVLVLLAAAQDHNIVLVYALRRQLATFCAEDWEGDAFDPLAPTCILITMPVKWMTLRPRQIPGAKFLSMWKLSKEGRWITLFSHRPWMLNNSV